MFRGIVDVAQDGNKYRHLRIVISHISDDDRALVIPISTVYKEMTRYDRTCILKKGEHSFLTEEESYAYYAMAQALTQRDLDELDSLGLLIKYEDASIELIEKLQKGAKQSPHLENVFKKYFDEF